MKKQMKRTVYEAPLTERFQVELEGVFCASADVENPAATDTKNGAIANQEVNTSFDEVTFGGTWE